MSGVDRLTERFTSLGRALISRPLSPAEQLWAATALLISGTIYCAAYCRIAFYPMHAGAMPLWLSAWWAATSLLPWLLAFELVKRVVPRIRSHLLRFGAYGVIALTTAAFTVVAYWLTDIEMMKMSATRMPMLVASQMQPVILFVLMVALWSATPHSFSASDARADAELLPPITSIDWIRAAGNYVEIKCGERLVMHRMTMRSAEAATRGGHFVRIHRSVIVRKALIRGFTGSGRTRLLLADGETLPVGDTYRPAVERIVPPSQGPALRPIPL